MTMSNEFEQETTKVSDKPLEVGLKLNNVLLFLIIAVMSWVGINIDRLRDDLAKISTATTVNSVRIDALEKDFQAHINRAETHWEKSK